MSFDPDLIAEYHRVGGIQNTKTLIGKFEKCLCKTTVSLRELVRDNYPDFILCFSQIRDIEQTFIGKHSNFEKMLQKMGKILQYQDAVCFDFDFVKWAESASPKYEDEKSIIVIPGNEIVDSPSSLIDDISSMIDEKKWKEAIRILNVLSQDLYRGEYAYLAAKTRKQIKAKIVRLRKKIFEEVSNLLLMNAYNKLYRHRLTVYILKIQKRRYFNRGIKLFLRCKLKEMDQNMEQLHLSYDLKTYVIDLTILCFQTIRELISEFNAILVESGHWKVEKDAMSFLTVFILKDVLVGYVDKFKAHVFEASKCDISLKAMGECLRISYGYLNKLKWNGLYLEMHQNAYLFGCLCDSLRLYFEDEISETRHALINDAFQIKEISLSKSSNPKAKKRRSSFRKYEAVITDAHLFPIQSAEGGEKKMKIFITSSAQSLYDQIRKILTESRSLLSFSYYPIMTRQIISVLLEEIIKFLQDYCSAITQMLREYEESGYSEEQCIGMMSNVYYVANDLLQRISDRILRQATNQKTKTERIESFRKKIVILYQEQFKYFSKTIAIKLIPDFYQTASNEKDIASPSKQWLDLLQKMSNMNELCSEWMSESAARLIISSMVKTIVKQLNEEKYWKPNKKPISFGRLQQFIFDVKLFAFSVSDYLDDESKSIGVNAVINEAIQLYSETNGDVERSGFIIKSNQWYLGRIEAFFSLHPLLNLSN